MDLIRRFWWRFVWPPSVEGAAVPLIGAPRSGYVEAAEEARRMLTQQLADYDALDSKAATLIGASLVVVSLVVPNLTLRTSIDCALFAILVALLTHALLAAVRAFGVAHLEAGVTPASLVLLAQAKAAEAGAALGHMTARAYAANKPILTRKSQFLQLSLRSLAMALIPLLLLFATGAFSS